MDLEAFTSMHGPVGVQLQALLVLNIRQDRADFCLVVRDYLRLIGAFD